jgi:hypothetical protein
MLPDSGTNNITSNGFISFRIKLRQNLPVGSQMFNTAYIYFDQNSPVITNSTVNTLVVPTYIKTVNNTGNKIQVVPNPVFDYADIIIEQPFTNCQLFYFDAMGKEVKREIMKTGKKRMYASELKSGLYFLRAVIDSEKVSTVKFIVR